MRLQNNKIEQSDKDESSLGLQSMNSKTFTLRDGNETPYVYNLFHSDMVATNFKLKDYKILFNQKLKDFNIPITFMGNFISAKCIGNFVLDNGNIMIDMEEYAEIVYCTGTKIVKKNGANTIPIICVEDSKTLKKYHVWGLYNYSKSCGNVIK